MTTLQSELRRLSGTTLDVVGAANAWAGTTGKDLLGALNAKAGTTGLDLEGVANALGGTSGKGVVAALAAASGGGTPAPLNVTDSFTRADNASSLGTTETGQTWTVYGGTWGINTNRAYTSTSTADAIAAVDLGSATQDASVTLVALDPGSCLAVRLTDRNNQYLSLAPNSGNVQLYKKVAGGYTLLGSSSAAAAGDVIRTVANGTSLTVYRNGTSVIAVTDSAHTTGTRVGLRCDSVNARFDNFTATGV